MIELNSNALRLFFFVSFFIVFFMLERMFWARKNSSDGARLLANVSLLVIANGLLRLLLPAGAIGAAIYAQHVNWGVLNVLGVSHHVVVVFLSVIALDFFIYCQHVASHHWRFLWRFHQIHHSDQSLDVTTALRFHPVEILLSVAYKIVLIVVLGISFKAVLIFEIVLNVMAMATHSNTRLKYGDSLVRCFFVTPSMHVVHHSQRQLETDSNYGFCLSLWDRLFKTYKNEAASPLVIGLESSNAEAKKNPVQGQGFFSSLKSLLFKPFD